MASDRIISYWGSSLLPPLYDQFLWAGERLGMSSLRRSLLSAAHGRVLELGAGTGLNIRHYPPAVHELVLSEPEPGMAKRLRGRSQASLIPTEVVQADARALPFHSASFDTVVCTLVLCTVPDPLKTLAEARRVLREGGRLLFLEHVRAQEDSTLARWQDRLESPWKAFAYGCRCNQDTMALFGQVPLQVLRSRPARWRGMPPIVAPLMLGEAVAPIHSGR